MSKNRVWDLCKVLENEHRRVMLSEVYKSMGGGCNVGIMVEKMQGRLEYPAVTQYLKQFEQLGLLRRERSGKYVNYFDDLSEAAPDVAEVAMMIRDAMITRGDYDDLGMFRALMNAFRARVCNYLMKGGDKSKAAICAHFEHQPKYLVRDLQPAVESGLLTEYDEEYEFNLPSDPIIKRIVELSN